MAPKPLQRAAGRLRADLHGAETCQRPSASPGEIPAQAARQGALSIFAQAWLKPFMNRAHACEPG